MTTSKGCLKDALQAAVSDYEAPKGYFSKLSKLVSFKTESQLPERTPILYDYISNAIGPLFEELGYSLEVFEIPIVWLPLSYAGCSQHAPNEHIIKPLMREGIRTVTEIYWHLGEENNNTKDIFTSQEKRSAL